MAERTFSANSEQDRRTPALSIEDVFGNVVERLVRYVLYLFGDLQDALLSFEPIRRLVLFALAPRCFSTVTSHVVPVSRLRTRFDELNYYVDNDSKQLILQAGFHGLAANRQPSGCGAELPSLGRILVHTNCEQSGRFQEAIAHATGRELGTSILMVDAGVLNSLAQSTLGQGLEAASEELSCFGLFAVFVSWFLYGGRLAFVWDLVREFCDSFPGEVILFVRDVERTICVSEDTARAFSRSFGHSSFGVGYGIPPSKTVVIAGTSMRDFGTDLLARSDGEDIESLSETNSGNYGSNPNPAGLDDSPTALLDFNFKFSGEHGANTRDLLASLFSVRAQIQPPPEGAIAVRHRQQLMQDAEELRERQNFNTASRLARAAGVDVPDRSRVYKYRALTVEEWATVLSWAKYQELQLLESVELSRKATKPPKKSISSPVLDVDPVPSVFDESCEIGRVTPGMVRSMSAENGMGFCEMNLQEAKKQLVKEGLAKQPSGKDGGAENDWSNVRSTWLSLAMYSCNVLGGVLSQFWFKAHKGEEPAPGITHRQEQAVALIKNSQIVAEPPPAPESLTLSEASIWYGLKMLDRSGVSRNQVKPENVYERRLLADVLNSRDLGSGFSEVGALSKAKDALREAVQLPLQHPELFSKGSLVKPCKGVLLFGPPGTGKTMLARAAAAECGASFLSVQPSGVLSKWVGEGVRNVRAMFSLAVKLSPCVLFIDEVDALLGQRHLQEHEAMRELKNEFMTQWDGIRSGALGVSSRVMVLGATNRPQDIDEAVLRRFSRRIFCDLPDENDRKAVLGVMLAGEDVSGDLDMDELANMTKGFSGSDLRQLCTSAAMVPIREYLAESSKAEESGDKDGDNGPDSQGGGVAASGTVSVNGGTENSNVLTGDWGSGVESKSVSQEDSVRKLILADFEKIMASVKSGGVKLRPIKLSDFKQACKEVTPSVEMEGVSLQDLRQWNDKFGDGALASGRRDQKLSYFM